MNNDLFSYKSISLNIQSIREAHATALVVAPVERIPKPDPIGRPAWETSSSTSWDLKLEFKDVGGFLESPSQIGDAFSGPSSIGVHCPSKKSRNAAPVFW